MPQRRGKWYDHAGLKRKKEFEMDVRKKFVNFAQESIILALTGMQAPVVTERNGEYYEVPSHNWEDGLPSREEAEKEYSKFYCLGFSVTPYGNIYYRTHGSTGIAFFRSRNEPCIREYATKGSSYDPMFTERVSLLLEDMQQLLDEEIRKQFGDGCLYCAVGLPCIHSATHAAHAARGVWE